MQIRIIVEEKLVAVNNAPLTVPAANWSRFNGDPASPWDDIAAVQFDTNVGQGHVEYKEVVTGQVTRPNMRPPDWRIGTEDFANSFAWIMPFYEARKAEVDAERERAAIAAEQARIEREAAELQRRQAEADAHNQRLHNLDQQPAPVIPDNLITREDLDAALAAQAEAHKQEMAEFAARLAEAAAGDGNANQ